VVDECGRSNDCEIGQEVCQKTGGEGLWTVHRFAGLGWLQIQEAGCQGTFNFEILPGVSPCGTNDCLSPGCWSSAGDAGCAGNLGGTGGAAGGAGSAGASGATATRPDAGPGAGGISAGAGGTLPADAGRPRPASQGASNDAGCSTVGSRPGYTANIAWLALAVALGRRRRWRFRRQTSTSFTRVAVS
jgi:uncharacterized protein (TIGR03382 family)